MVVPDVTGVHTITYRYSGCEKSKCVVKGSLGQLLGNSWYPAMTVDPKTCATIKALETFRLLSVVGNVNVHDYVAVLERKVDLLQVGKVPVHICLSVSYRRVSDFDIGPVQSFQPNDTTVQLPASHQVSGPWARDGQVAQDKAGRLGSFVLGMSA
jgi:hypothetical protein